MEELYRESDYHRYIDEKRSPVPWRGDFRRDFSRVIHSPSFRRLQGKTQLFPSHESDFFRNRLTHSLEVAQIAEGIAERINHTHSYFKVHPIDPRVCHTAALLHDLGHPPFGHNGEEALDEAMRPSGGFEGNAQSLRIVTQVEKKRFVPEERCLLKRRAGLNLTYRVLASILKYDAEIPLIRDPNDGVKKGYYSEDASIVRDIKSKVAPEWAAENEAITFKTIECSIMDIADDIAYSTYDLEDSLKAGFLKPSTILTMSPRLADNVAKKVSKTLGRMDFDGVALLGVFVDMFRGLVDPSGLVRSAEEYDTDELIQRSVTVVQELDNIAEEGELRTAFTSDLVSTLVESVDVELNEKFPQLSRIVVKQEALTQIEALKRFTYEATIASSRVRLAEYRGKEVVRGLFEALSDAKGVSMLPRDVASLYYAAEGDLQKQRRVISDFIAGMTDRYALEFFGRLHSDSPQTMFKPA